MAISPNSVLEVRTTGTDTNGGGFVTGAAGTDYSQQDAKNTFVVSAADLTIDATINTRVTSASHTFVAGDIGKYVVVTAGTSWTPGQYLISSITGSAANLGSSPSAAGNANKGTYLLGLDMSVTNAVANGTTTITSATAAFGPSIVGSIVYFQGGSGSITGTWRQVTARASASSITIDLLIASSTGMTMNIGGALKTPGQASAIMVTGNIAYLKNVGADGASIFSITSASAAVTNGVISNANQVYFQGYTSTRSLGNTNNRPTIQLNVASATMWSSGSGIIAQGIVCDGNSQTSAKMCAATGSFIRCLFNNFNVATTNTPNFLNCVATTNSAVVFVAKFAVRCEAYANTATGFQISSAAIDCIASGNTGATTDGFIATASGSVFSGCIAISNGLDGFHITGANLLVNCHAESNTGVGYQVISPSISALLNCSAYGNSSPTNLNSNNVSNVGFITVTVGSVFVNAGANNYALNSTVNQGALLRAAADPATFPRGLTANFRDIGAAQHQDTPSTTTNIFVIDD